ncbi:MAG TPA: sulfite exporter TauE/SafE family protein [Gaiellales bacterium]|jgi:hypothetical protein
MSWQLALSGLLIGALVGTTGMGGGSLMTPLLVIAFGFDPAVAVGTDLVHGALFKSVGALRHRSLGTVQARLSGWMLLGSAPMSLVGVWASTWIHDRYGDGAQTAQSRVLGAALVIGAAGLVAKNLMRFRSVPDGPFVLTRRDRIAAVLIGLGGGFMVGLTSVGSGVFFGLSLLILFPLRSSKVVGTDIFHAAALLWVAGAGHLVAGNVDLGSVGWLLVGSLPGVLIGSQVSVRLPDRVLQLSLAVVLAASGVKLVDLPDANESAIGVLCAGLIALAVFARRQRVAQLAPG